jgi:hypothetical protein
MRRRWVVLTAAIAAAGLGVSTYALTRSDDPKPRPRPTPAALAPTPISTPTPTPTPSTTPPPPLPRLAANSVVIPSLRVNAPIEGCQVINGELEGPANVHHTCYWQPGAAVGSATGTTLIIGHINWVGQGTGALGNIDRLRAGNTVYTAGKGGQTERWRVVEVTHRPKKYVNTAVYAGPSGARQLFLVTCGGPFDAAHSNYLENIYVRAVPA